MPQVELPEVTLIRRRTRTYDTPPDNLIEIVAAIRQLLTPTAAIQPYFSTEPPGDGFLFCDGAYHSKADFPNLYDRIQGLVPETTDTFATPDLRGRVPFGIDGNAGLTLGQLAGADEVTLTIPNLPSHDHTVTDPGHDHTFTGDPHDHGVTDPGHSHTGAAAGTADTTGADAGIEAGDTSTETTGITVDSETADGTVGNNTTGLTVDPTGSGTPFSIIPPVFGCNWIIRT